MFFVNLLKVISFMDVAFTFQNVFSCHAGTRVILHGRVFADTTKIESCLNKFSSYCGVCVKIYLLLEKFNRN